MKRKIAVLTVLTVLFIGSAAAFAQVRTSDIVGGNAFVEGETIEISYAVETSVAGDIQFKIDGTTKETDKVFVSGGSTENTYTYRTSELSPGTHTYQAFFQASNGESFSSEQKQVKIVEPKNAPESQTPTNPTVTPATDPAVEYGNDFEREYFPSFGFQQEKTFPVVNNRDQEVFVSMSVPNTANGCQYIRLQENNGRNADFGKSARYELPEESQGVRKTQTRKEFQVQFNIPSQEKWQQAGLSEIRCDIAVDTSAGEVEDMTLVAEPTESSLTKITGDFTKLATGNQKVNIAGTQLGLVPLAGIAFLVFVILGAITTRTETPGLGEIINKIRN